MRGSCLCGFGLLGLIVAFVPRAASAAPIEWEAPEACPSKQVFEQKLERALGHDESDLGSLSRVRGVLVAESDGYRLTLEVVAPGGRSLRTIRAKQCEDLASAAALAIALAVHGGPDARDGAASSVRARGAAGDTAAVQPIASSPVPRDRAGAAGAGAADASPALSWAAGGGAVLDVGALPEPQLGIALSARAALASFELDVHGLLLPSQLRGVGDGESVELGLIAAGLRVCHRLLEQGVVAAACLGGEAGRFMARGIGLEPEREARDLWLAVGAGLLARTAFAGPLQLELLAEPLLPLARKQYAVDAQSVIHAPSAVDVRFQLGLVIGVGPAAAH